jgi:methyl-accepting chemotaxis protein
MRHQKTKTKTLSLWIKIAILPMLGLLSLFVIKGTDFYLNAKTERASAMGQYASNIAWMMTERVLYETEFLNKADEKVVKQIQQQSARIDQTLAEAKRLDDDRRMQKLVEDVEKAAARHRKAFEDAAKMVRTLKESQTQFMSQLNETDTIIKEAIGQLVEEKSMLIMMEGRDLPEKKKALREGFRELSGYISPIMLNLNDLVSQSDAKSFEETAAKLSEDIQTTFKNSSGMVAAVAEEKYTGYFKKIKASYDAVMKQQETLFTQWKELRVLAADLEKTNVALKGSIQGIVTGAIQKSEDIKRFENLLSIITIVVTVLLLISLGIMVIRSVTKSVNRVASGLNEVSEEVSNASSQVSQVSHQLSDGSATQAAAIEETSASLEEMSSMTKQNAEHAEQANKLASDTSLSVKEANNSMDRLTEAMETISRSSEETQKIIKTIDEIAFQTNLLALNAAVEAARAGEAGAGFAVVADEVRNLAMRAADAAKNTGELIEESVKQIKAGSDILNKTNTEFDRVAEGSEKVEQLVGEIAAASQEQAHGIVQINQAVSEVEVVTQRNSANAEEATAVSEEMNFRSQQMKEFVDELIALLGKNASLKMKVDDVGADGKKEARQMKAGIKPALPPVDDFDAHE